MSRGRLIVPVDALEHLIDAATVARVVLTSLLQLELTGTLRAQAEAAEAALVRALGETAPRAKRGAN